MSSKKMVYVPKGGTPLGRRVPHGSGRLPIVSDEERRRRIDRYAKEYSAQTLAELLVDFEIQKGIPE